MTNTPETNKIIRNLKMLYQKYDERLLTYTVELVAALIKSKGLSTKININGLEELLHDYDTKKVNYENLIVAIAEIIKNYNKEAVAPLRELPLTLLQVIYMIQHPRYTDSGCMFKFEKEGHNKPFEKAVLEA